MSVGFDVSVLVVGYLMVIGVVMDIYLVVAVVNCMFVLDRYPPKGSPQALDKKEALLKLNSHP